MKINNSRIVTYRQCQRRYYWNYVHGGTGIVKRDVPQALGFGQIVHHLLASYYAEEDWKAELEPALRDAVPGLDSLDFDFKNQWYADLEWAERLVREYVKWAGQNDKFSVVQLECEGTARLGTICYRCGAAYSDDQELTSCPTCSAEVHYLVYKIDALINQSGKVFPMDHKTTKGLGSVYIESWNYSPQMHGYVLGAKATHPGTDRFQMNFLKKLVGIGKTELKTCPDCRNGKRKVQSCVTCTQSGKVKRDIPKDPPFYRPAPTLVTPENMDRFQISRISACNDIQDSNLIQIDENPLTSWPMEIDQCFAKGPCPYLSLCYSGDALKWNTPAEELTMAYHARGKDYVSVIAKEEEV